MGMLVEGQWVDENEAKNKTDKSGAFKRTESGFRNWVTTDGSAGPTGGSGFVPDRGRYHLYVAMNCPWAHRTLLMRTFKGLDDTITLDKTVPGRTDQGWYFNDEYVDNVLGKSALHQIYTKADANCIKDGVVQPDSSPLMCSCIKGHVTIAQKLLQAGALIDMKDKRHGRSALHYACCEDQLACVKLLIDAGADVNTSTPTGGTPVIYCGEGGKVACLRELIAARADLDYQDISDETALSLSATKGARCPFHRAASSHDQGSHLPAACARCRARRVH